jgi:predicted transcriptional regulator
MCNRKTACELGESRGKVMKRSKLEMYIDILRVIAHTGPLKLTHIAHQSNVNISVLKEYLAFLIKQGLVEEHTVKKSNTIFTVTQRGITVLKFFGESMQEISVIEKA